MKKVVKIIGALLAIILVVLAALYFINNEDRPTGNSGTEAEALAQKIMTAINKEAWDSTRYVQWTFRGEHHFLWDKDRHYVEAQWHDYKVFLDVDNRSGVVYENKVEVTDSEQKKELLDKAYSYFINDAFWLNAPSMIFNDDVRREVVELEDARKGLMVTYMSGGVTPGDSYLWLVDESGRPTSYKMWVKIIPVGGMEFTWEDWMQLNSGAWIAQQHKSSALSIPITNLRDGQRYEDVGRSTDPFAQLPQKKSRNPK